MGQHGGPADIHLRIVVDPMNRFLSAHYGKEPPNSAAHAIEGKAQNDAFDNVP